MRRERLPGGVRPTFLVEDVAGRWFGPSPGTTSAPNQLWRLDVPESVTKIEYELRRGDRVLVGLPADEPFIFYATRRGWDTSIIGTPVPEERLFLVIRSDERPERAIRENLSLRRDEPWLLSARWELLARGALSIWFMLPSEPNPQD